MPTVETTHTLSGLTPFESEPFLAAWEETLACKFPIIGRLGPWCITQKTMAKGLVRLKELRVPGWNATWSDGVTPQHLETLVQSAQSASGWDIARLTLWESPQLQTTQAMLRHGGFSVALVPELPDYRMDLTQGWEGYLALRGGANRRKILKRFREVAPLNPQLNILDPQTSLNAFLDALIPDHIAYWQRKNGAPYMADPREQAFLRAWTHTLAQQNQLELDELVLDNQVINRNISIRVGEIKYALITANTGALEEHFPGVLGLYYRIEKAANQGHRWLLVGHGDYAYKVQASTHAVPRVTMVVAHPRSLLGRGLVHTLQKKHAALPLTPQPTSSLV